MGGIFIFNFCFFSFCFFVSFFFSFFSFFFFLFSFFFFLTFFFLILSRIFKPPLPKHLSNWEPETSPCGEHGRVSPRLAQAGCAYKLKYSQSRNGFLFLSSHRPDHDVSIELRDIQKEHAETNTSVCCPVKVCLFWPEDT